MQNSDFLSNQAQNGGAINVYFLEYFTLSNVRFFQNIAEVGGAILTTGTNLYADNCKFEDNVAYLDGGAISTSDNISIQNSYFKNNRAIKGFGGVVSVNLGRLFMLNCTMKNCYAANGGVIQGSESDINLTYCIFESNRVDITGGVMHIRDSRDAGGSANPNGSTILVLNSHFSGNIAPNGNGGVIYIFAEVLKIFNSTFSNNIAKGAGVIQVIEVKEIQVNNSIFVDNFSLSSVIINVTQSTFLATKSTFHRNVFGYHSYGGCLTFTYGKANLENCTLSRNINKNEGKGGAIHSEKCKLRISTSIFDDNEAVSGKDIFLNNDLLTYLSVFKHSQTYKSNDENFKDEVFQENIFSSDDPNNVTVSESQYASGKSFCGLFPLQHVTKED